MCLVNIKTFLLKVDLIAQSDSVYDIVDPSDHFVMRSNLAPAVTGDKGKHPVI